MSTICACLVLARIRFTSKGPPWWCHRARTRKSLAQEYRHLAKLGVSPVGTMHGRRSLYSALNIWLYRCFFFGWLCSMSLSFIFLLGILIGVQLFENREDVTKRRDRSILKWPGNGNEQSDSPDWCKLLCSICVRIRIRTFGARRRSNLEKKFQCGRFARNA